MNLYEILFRQMDVLAIKEQAMRYYRRKGIDEAVTHFGLSVNLPDEYQYTKPKEDEGYEPPAELPATIKHIRFEEQKFGARDVLRKAGKSDEEIKQYLTGHYGISEHEAQSTLEYDYEDFKGRIGGVT